MLVLDASHQIRYFNARAAEFLGVDPAAIAEESVETVISQTSGARPDPEAERAVWDRLLSHPDEPSSIEISAPGPPQRDILVSSFSVADAREATSLGLLMHDVTTAKALALLQERERIAMDLHDGVIQSLHGLALRLGGYEHMLDEKMEGTREVLQQARSQIHKIIEEIRTDIYDLRRYEGQPSSLQVGLKELTRELRAAAAIRAELDLDTDACDSIDLASVDSMLRIAREATSNVIRHAQASEVTIQMARMDHKVILSVRDNGRGFNQDAGAAPIGSVSDGHGLHNMAERAHMLGGQLVVRSTPGRGTEVRVEVVV